jgi:hypothetical protein
MSEIKLYGVYQQFFRRFQVGLLRLIFFQYWLSVADI